MLYQIHTTQAAQLAEAIQVGLDLDWQRQPGVPLTLEVDSDRLIFDGAVLGQMRERYGPDDDGFVGDDGQGQTCLWIGGDGYPVEAV